MTTTINASTSAGLVQTADTSGSLALQTASTTALTIDSSQNVGIGITPSAFASSRKALQVGGSSTVATLGLSSGIGEVVYNTYYDGTNFKYINTNYAASFDYNNAATGGFAWRLAPSGTAGTNVTLTEAMRINSSGYVGIGDTNPQSSLAVNSTTNPQIRVAYTGVHTYGVRVTSGGNFAIQDTDASSADRLTIDSSGNLKLTNSNNIASITQTAISLTGAGGGGTGGQTVNIITANSTTRGILIVGSTQNCSAIFFINGGGVVNLSSQTTNETRFSITSGAANTANVYASGSNIVLQNNIQAARDFYVTYIGQL